MEYWQIALLVTLPMIGTGFLLYFLLKEFFKEESDKRKFEMRKMMQKNILPQKLNAYERMALLLERIKPSALVQRIAPTEDLATYELALIKNIQTEFDHNLSQQIYVNPETWKIIYSAKNATQNFIRECAVELGEGSTGSDLQEKILQKSTQETSPSSKAMLYLQKDIQGN